MQLKSIVITLAFSMSYSMFAQPFIRLQPFAKRQIKTLEKNTENEISFKITDTLNLPFFEDFSNTSGYPDAKRWLDNLVWVNNTFPKKAPNFGVATFDHLNAHGNPYQTLDKREMVFADSLSSQPINLQYRKVGISTVNYKPEDSIYLSFFVQRQGIGDAPEPEDSLLIFFKTNTGNWIRNWAVGGGFVGNFVEYFIPIADYRYLIPDFQFRIVNYTKATGNLNHWNIDYLRIDKNRKAGEISIEDVGIASVEYGLFKDFNNIPFGHYKFAKTGILGNGPAILVRNLNAKTAVQTRFQLSIYNQFNKKIYSKLFNTSSRNLNAKGDTTERYPSLLFDTLSTATPNINYIFSVDPQSNDNTPDAYQSSSNNNSISQSHRIMPWYAYDDGSAEGGIGLDYAYLGNLKGQFAMEFKTLKDDSLRGLSIYFNQSLVDVSGRSFKLRIWKAISPSGRPDDQDKLLYEFPVSKPLYMDSVNGFSYIFFDSTLFLSKGNYYVGWIQQMPYVLNIGYDNNYRFQNIEQGNPHLFSNLLGSWEKAGIDAKGTPMIRMLFGERKEYAFATAAIDKFTVGVYPNPCQDIVFVKTNPGSILQNEIWDFSGALIMKCPYGNSIFVGNLKPGHYILHSMNENKKPRFTHFIKL